MAYSMKIIKKNIFFDIVNKSPFRRHHIICPQSVFSIFQRPCSNDCNEEQEKPLQYKVALVTGGCSEIGYHISEQFLKAGAQAVVLSDITEEECCKATENLNEIFGQEKAIYHTCDVRKKGDIEKVFKCIIQRFGRIDIIVNNASIMAENRWEDTIAVNIKGLVHATTLGFEHMSTKNCGLGGIIVNRSSIFGLQPFYPTPVYTGTEHFIIGFTRSLGNNYFFNQSKVKVMAFCPGITETRNPFDPNQGQFGKFEELGKEAEKALKCFPGQGPEVCGKCIMEMIKSGENGSIWVAEGCEIYKVSIPDRHTFKPKKKNEYDNTQRNSKNSTMNDFKPGEMSVASNNVKEDTCKSNEDFSKPKQDLCEPNEDSSESKHDICKPKDESSETKVGKGQE